MGTIRTIYDNENNYMIYPLQSQAHGNIVNLAINENNFCIINTLFFSQRNQDKNLIRSRCHRYNSYSKYCDMHRHRLARRKRE